jgi:hypothetical protein
MGPDRDITIKVYDSRLKSVQTSAKVDEKLQCRLGVDVEVEGSADEWEITLIKEDGTVVTKERAKGKVDWEVKDADLWWPVGEGSPTRYTVKVILLDKASVPHTQIAMVFVLIRRTAQSSIHLPARSASDVSSSCKIPSKGRRVHPSTLKSTTSESSSEEVIGFQSIRFKLEVPKPSLEDGSKCL